MNNTIICDQGTGSLKLGYAGDKRPREIIPSLIGYRRSDRKEERKGSSSPPFHPSISIPTKETVTKLPDNRLYGQDVLESHSHELKASKYLMKDGIVQDWDEMEYFWNNSFDKFLGRHGHDAIKTTSINRNSNCIDPKECQMLMTEPVLNPTMNRNKSVEYMFENLGIAGLNLSMQAVLVLYSQGLLTGMVIDCGEGVTQVVPVFEGYVANHLVKRHAINGRKISSYFARLLSRQGYYSNISSSNVLDLEAMREVKEKYCYTACDLEEDRKLARETTVLVEKYTLPDGTNIKVREERFEAPEAMFDPSLIDVDSHGIADLVFNTIQECDISCRLQYYRHMVLSGGGSMFPGMSNRIENHVRDRYLRDILKGDRQRLKKFKINVEAPTNRNNMVFLGGSILGDIMKNSPEFWISKEDYEEMGVERAMANCHMT